MADEKSELAIVIEAINNASKTIKQVENDLSGLNKSVDKQNNSSQKAFKGFNSLVGSFFAGNIAANLATKAVGELGNIIKETTDAIETSLGVASDYERSLMALSRISQRFGEDENFAKESAIRLAADGLITVNTAANGLQKLMQGGLGLDKAIELMESYKDEAAFGRSSTIGYDQAVSNLSESFYTENSMIGNLSGQTENWNILLERGAELLGKNTGELTKTERAQAKYLAQKELSLLTEGDSIEYANTYSGQLSKLQTGYKQLHNVIGNLFMPVAKESTTVMNEFLSNVLEFADNNGGKLLTIGEKFSETISGVFDDFSDFVERNSNIIYEAINFIISGFQRLVAYWKTVLNVIQIVINAFETLANGLVTNGRIIFNALKGDWEGVANAQEDWFSKTEKIDKAFLGNLEDIEEAGKDYFNSYVFDLRKWWKNIEETESDGIDKIEKLNRESREQETEEERKVRIKKEKEIDKENLSYQRGIEKRVKAFEESFEDLVLSHRDAIQQLTEDLEEEKISYEKSLSGLGSDYDEAMADIKKSHADKTESIIEDMEEERKRSEEEIEKITEAYNAEVGLIEKEGQARLNNLKTQLAREEALGAMADSEKVASLKAMIAYEEKGLADSLAGRKSVYDEEVSDVEEKLNSELEKIKEGLEEENLVYEEALAERKTQYEEDVASLKESYIEKKETIQEELDEELLIREKYSEDFARLADKVADDDITRLVNKFNEEKDEMQREHEERLAEIGASAVESGEQLINGFNEGFDSAYPTFKQRVSQMESDIDNVLSKSSGLATIVGANAGINYSSSFRGGGGGGGGGGGAYAEGGLATRPSLVGEAGPEIVLPLSFPKRMADIMKNMGLSDKTRGNVVQNFYVTVKKEADVDMLMERASFAMKSGGGQR